MRLVLLSDTHGHHEKVTVPDGDLLLFGGDMTNFGRMRDIERFDEWLSRLPHRRKVVIAGNHDFPFEKEPLAARQRIQHATYLQDEMLEIDGLRIFASPCQPEFCRMAFNRNRLQLKELWREIPEGVDVLLTHGPPFGILDRTTSGQQVGCPELRERVAQLKPRLHLFGHIHEGYGLHEVGPTTFVNASICQVNMQPLNPALIFDW